MQSVADATVDVIVNRGVTHVFGLLGEGNLEVAYAIENERDVNWVPMRREDSVVSAADGFAQGRGRRVGVGTVTHGPALANAITALVGAAKGCTPLVLLCGELTTDEHAHPQWIDQAALLYGTGAQYRSVRDPAIAKAEIAAAFAVAETRRTPVVIGVPAATQRAHAGADAAPRAEPRPSHSEPDPAAITELAARLHMAERPVVLAGRGAVEARDALCELADRCGSLLATTLLARGLFHDEPFDIGVCGGFATGLTQQIVADADLVMAFGASLSPYTTKSGALLRMATVAQVDDDPAAFGRQLTPDIAVLGDCADVAHRLTEALPSRRTGYRQPAVGQRIAEYDPIEDFVDESGAAGLDLRAVSRLLDRALPAERALTTDLGYFTSEPVTHVRVDHPSKFGFPLHFGSIGLGLATAIGLSCAHPAVPTVCVVGDGGLAASVGELDTLSRMRLPVVVAVFDDEAYGVEYQALRDQGRPTSLSVFPPVDLAAVARGYGIDAVTVRTIDEFDDVKALLAKPSAPLLLDFKLNPRIITRWYRDVTSSHADTT